jgi:carboxypeptidase T
MHNRTRVVISIVVIIALISVALVPNTMLKNTLMEQTADIPVGPQPFTRQGGNASLNFSEYVSYSRMINYIQGLQNHYPRLVQVKTLGQTYDGHDIWAVKISDNVKKSDDQGNQHEPDVLYVGLHHGGEWMSTAFNLYFINYLVTAYNDPENENHTRVRWMLDNRELWFVPMLNPDAYIYNGDGDFDSKTNWRKNREPNYAAGSETALPEGAWGTDLNRNYQWHWGDEINEDNTGDGRGSSWNPYSSVYRGPNDDKDDDGDSLLGIDTGDPFFGGPDLDKVDEDPVDGEDNDGDGKIDEDPDGGFSAAETIALKKLAEDNKFIFSLSYHTYSELVIYPWGHTGVPCPDDWLFKKVGGVLANLTGYRLIKGWDFYRTTGDFDDWMYAVHNIYAMTIELCSRDDGGHMTPPDRIVATGEKNVRAAEYVAMIADNPEGNYLHITHDPLEDTNDFKGPYEVSAQISDPDEAGGVGKDVLFQDMVYLHYKVGDEPYRKVRMDDSEEMWNYKAEIPGQERGSKISYYIEAYDERDVNVSSPQFAPYNTYSFNILEPVEPGVVTRLALVLSILFFFSVTWGSFIFCVVLAVKAERRKMEVID